MMNILAPVTPLATTAPATQWPTMPAVEGKYYVFTDKRATRMVAMTQRTFEFMGTEMEQQRRTLALQDTKIKDIQAISERLVEENRQLTERLQNLRSVRRVEKRVDLEKEMVLPGDPRFGISNSITEAIKGS